ncbi:MAG: DUF4230 domain-containing protein [Acidimicrobiia bacterium]
MSEQVVDQRPRRSPVVPLAVMGTIVAVVVIIGMFVNNGIRDLVGAIPGPADVAAVVEPQPYEQVGPVVVDSIRDLANLTTVETIETTIVDKGTDAGWLDWARGDSLSLFAVARIGAGVDLAQLQTSDFSVSADGVVTVTLPHAEIQYVSVDNEATQVLTRDKGLFTKGDDRLETETRQLAETVLVKSAEDQGIIAKAEANAESVLTGFIGNLGYEDVVIQFDA